jgi:hypothetical protein
MRILADAVENDLHKENNTQFVTADCADGRRLIGRDERESEGYIWKKQMR